MTDYRKMTDKSGQSGENLLQWYCDTYGFTYSEPTDKITTGVDCYLNGVPTDVKNTLKIMVGNYRLKNSSKAYKDTFISRMPFKDSCKAIDYCILDIDPINKSQKIHYHGRIDTYLAENYFNDSKALSEGFKIIDSYDRKSASNFGFEVASHLLYDLKEKLIPHLKPNVVVVYQEESLLKYFPNAEELQFYIIKIDDYKTVEARRKWWSEKLKK
jgi:hypothetical protein